MFLQLHTMQTPFHDEAKRSNDTGTEDVCNAARPEGISRGLRV